MSNNLNGTTAATIKPATAEAENKWKLFKQNGN